MKACDLVRTSDGRLGIIKSYYPQYDSTRTNTGSGTSYPWYVHMLDNSWHVEYFQTDQLEVISECG
jgi:hypothetical protein